MEFGRFKFLTFGITDVEGTIVVMFLLGLPQCVQLEDNRMISVNDLVYLAAIGFVLKVVYLLVMSPPNNSHEMPQCA